MHSVYSRIQELFYPIEKNLYALFIVLGVLFLAGCASHGKIAQSTTIEAHSIKTIGFRIPETGADALSGIEAHQIDTVSREISRRFAAAGYPVTAYARANPSSGRADKLSKNPRLAYSHILEASTGPIEQDNTPSGFSFALGDSDPRSKQFQKAKVVEVTCTLRDLADPEAAVTLVERKAADSISDTAKDQAQIAQQFYVETIVSTCHNLLTKLDVFPQDTEEQAVVGNSKNSYKPARVSDEPKQIGSWRDKQTRIFNQGDTVILEFGYERR